MGLSEEYKKRLNILIPFYRKKRLDETQDGQWQQGWFYKDDVTGTSICSSKIYCSLEKGIKVAHDDVYIFASKKLHKDIFESQELDEAVNEIVNMLFSALNYKEEAQAIDILEKGIHLLSLYQHAFYYGEIYWFFIILQNFLKNRSHMMTQEDFTMLDTIEGIYNGNLHELVIYYLYVYANYHLIEYEAYVLNKYDYKHSNFISNRLFYISKYERKGLYLQAYQQYQELEKELLNANNMKQLAYVYMYMTGMLLHIDYEQMDIYRGKLIYMLNEQKFRRQQYYLIYMNLGTIYIFRDMYMFSIECIMKAFDISDKMYFRSFICLSYCFSKIGKEAPKKIYKNNTSNEESNKVDIIVYEYFLNKKYKSNRTNRVYILKKFVLF